MNIPKDKRPKLGVDIDDVTGQCVLSMLAFHNEKYGSSFQYKDVVSYSLAKVLGGSDEDIIRKISEYYKTKHFEDMSSVEGASESLTLLSYNYDIIGITARPESTREVTEKWIDKHFPNIFQKIHMTSKATNEGKKKKSEVCKEEGIKIMIDDSLENAEDCAENNINVLLMNHPWNQSKLRSGIIRVQNWKEVFEIINKRLL